jgi:hypothetical protein
MSTIWYCEPGEMAIKGTTTARDLTVETITIRIPDLYDLGEREITVPSVHVHLAPDDRSQIFIKDFWYKRRL